MQDDLLNKRYEADVKTVNDEIKLLRDNSLMLIRKDHQDQRGIGRS